MDRKPNEILVDRELMEQLLTEGQPRTYRVERGPASEARLVNVRWAGDWIVLEYDRPVEEPMLSVVYAAGRVAASEVRGWQPSADPPEPPTSEFPAGGQHPGEIGTGWT